MHSIRFEQRRARGWRAVTRLVRYIIAVGLLPPTAMVYSNGYGFILQLFIYI